MLIRIGAHRYWWIWVAVAPILIWTVIRFFGLDSGYPLVPLMAFTPYAAIAAFLVGGVATALRNWAAAGTAGIAVVCLAVAVLPRTVGSATADAEGHETFTVLASNVYYGDADPTALVSLVDRYHPDLLSVEELTPGLAARLVRAGLSSRLPHSILMLRHRTGTGLYSRLPMRRLPNPAGSFFPMPRAKVALADGRSLRVVGVHPYPPLHKHFGGWQTALESLPTAGSGIPWVLAGDFNATLDNSELRDILADGYRDAGEVTGKGLEPTWPADRELPPPITIDHVLADGRLGIADYGVEDLPGSDHRSIHAELVMP